MSNCLEEAVQSKLKKIKSNDLPGAIDVFFTKRQKEIIYMKFLGEPLTKTEREYFSRVMKKRLKAIAHPALHKICEQLTWSLY